MKIAEVGLQELQKYVDTYIPISNQNLFKIANEKTTFAQAFKLVDDVLFLHVREISSLMVVPGYINLDFADVRSIMTKMGKAHMGTGEASGENRAVKAAEQAILNPLLDNVSMKDANGILINITGGEDMTLFEVDSAANTIREQARESANIIFGSTFNKDMEGTVRVSVVATGINVDVEEYEEEAEDSRASSKFIHSKEYNTKQKELVGGIAEKDLLDIPAFLRRAKKKNI